MTLIFGKDNCPYTIAAREDFEHRRISFEYVNVKRSAADLDRSSLSCTVTKTS